MIIRWKKFKKKCLFLKLPVISTLDSLIKESHLFIQHLLTTLQMKGSLSKKVKEKKLNKNTYN